MRRTCSNSVAILLARAPPTWTAFVMLSKKLIYSASTRLANIALWNGLANVTLSLSLSSCWNSSRPSRSEIEHRPGCRADERILLGRDWLHGLLALLVHLGYSSLEDVQECPSRPRFEEQVGEI